eukprot:scaffold39012_cov191-Amphora_coffeaeformis.AAC.6
MEHFVRNLYRDMQVWYQTQQEKKAGDRVIILLDDVSALADMVGSKLAHAFVYQVTCWVNNNNNNNIKLGTTGTTTRLVIRCAGDGLDDTSSSTDNIDEQQQQQWVGHGGGSATTSKQSLSSLSSCCWESSLVELCDLVVDVLPLQSGYSREAHGRLLLTSRISTTTPPVRYNYCFTDQAVFAIRLTSSQKRRQLR